MVSAALLAGCSGNKTASTEQPAAPHESNEHAEMANMPPAMVKFHDVLAPRWHAAKGEPRMTDTCAAIPDFTAGVTAIATAAPPQGADSTAWNDGAGKLAAAVSALDEACKSKDAAGFETAFQTVHESFHGLMGLVMGEHEHAGSGHHEM